MLLRAFLWKFFQVVSSPFQWSCVANLKEFIFAIFALSGMFTWTCLWAYEKTLGRQLDSQAEFIKKRGDQIANTMELQQLVFEGPEDEKAPTGQGMEHPTIYVNVDASQQDNMAIQAVVTEQPAQESRDIVNIENEEENMINETCIAFCKCFCFIGLCFLCPCKFPICPCIYGGAKEMWKGFSTSFSTYSTNMTTLLKEPIQDEDNRFFRIKASLTSIFVQEVYISTDLNLNFEKQQVLKAHQ